MTSKNPAGHAGHDLIAVETEVVYYPARLQETAVLVAWDTGQREVADTIDRMIYCRDCSTEINTTDYDIEHDEQEAPR